MKRAAFGVLLAMGVGLAGGAALKGVKFRYLPASWNRTVEMTDIELACIRSAFRAAKPLVLQRGRLVATEIDAEPRATHIHLTVQVQPRHPPDEPLGPRDFERACAVAADHWCHKLLRRPVPETGRCPLTIDLVSGSKVLYRQINDAKGRRGFQNPPI